MNMTDDQRKVLDKLLDKYERSSTYKGTSKVKQKFSISPIEIMKEYYEDIASVDRVRDLNLEMQEMENKGLVTLQWTNREIRKIFAVREKLQEYYTLLGRKEKKVMIREAQDFYNLRKKKNIPVVTEFCEEQLQRIEEGKNPEYKEETAEEIMDLLEFILTNQEEVLERELSIMILGDSKKFENTYRAKICRIIRRYRDYSYLLEETDDEREQEKILLEEFGIYANPSYIYMKGNATLKFSGGRTLVLDEDPLAVSAESLSSLENIQVEAENVVTVENITSFHRIGEKNCFYVFLAGYHNSAKQEILKKIYRDNREKNWYHFGDMDPDGFCILENLRAGTGIDFQPLYMGKKELLQYESYGKPLNQNDRTKAENLIARGKHTEVLRYMLEHDCKLEQEIISFYQGKERKNKSII